MKEPNWSSCTEEQLWKYVAWHLAGHGIESILVGGAVVAVYSKGAYKSGDLDFIVTNFDAKKIATVLQELGFKKEGRHFIHPRCKHLFVEFPVGPLAIGSDYRIQPEVNVVNRRKIMILSPTDCVKDRLASYVYFKSRDALEQALLVAEAQPIELAEIKRWCKKEGVEAQFNEFAQLLEKRTPSKDHRE